VNAFASDSEMVDGLIVIGVGVQVNKYELEPMIQKTRKGEYIHADESAGEN